MRKSRKNPTPKPTAMIFADASLCPQTGASGWGAWVKHDGGVSQVFGGAFQNPMDSVTDAETAALASAMFRARHWQILTSGDVVMLQSDCTNALLHIRTHLRAFDSPAPKGVAVRSKRGPTKLSPVATKAIKLIEEIKTELGLTLITRHVKGHVSERVGRSWVNDQCDRTAKRHMRTKRLELQPQPLPEIAQ